MLQLHWRSLINVFSFCLLTLASTWQGCIFPEHLSSFLHLLCFLLGIHWGQYHNNRVQIQMGMWDEVTGKSFIDGSIFLPLRCLSVPDTIINRQPGIQSSFVLVEHLEAASLCSLNYCGGTFGGAESSLMLPDLFHGGHSFIAGCQVTSCLVTEVTWHEAFICHQKVVDQTIYFSKEFFCHS